MKYVGEEECIQADGDWTLVTNKTQIMTPRIGHTCAAFGNSIYLFGGYEVDAMSNDLYCLDFVISEWRKISPNSGSSPSHRTGMQAVAFEQEILFFGGCSKYLKQYHNDCYLFNPMSLEWKPINTRNVPSPRIDFGLCGLSKKRCILFGGLDGFMSYSDTHILDLSSRDHNTKLPSLGQR